VWGVGKSRILQSWRLIDDWVVMINHETNSNRSPTAACQHIVASPGGLEKLIFYDFFIFLESRLLLLTDLTS